MCTLSPHTLSRTSFLAAPLLADMLDLELEVALALAAAAPRLHAAARARADHCIGDPLSRISAHPQIQRRIESVGGAACEAARLMTSIVCVADGETAIPRRRRDPAPVRDGGGAGQDFGHPGMYA